MGDMTEIDGFGGGNNGADSELQGSDHDKKRGSKSWLSYKEIPLLGETGELEGEFQNSFEGLNSHVTKGKKGVFMPRRKRRRKFGSEL